jgi:hypothetical protein
MDEGRKRVLGIMASILAARKLAALHERDARKGSPVYVGTIATAIGDAEAIMSRIDDNWPTPQGGRERHISGTAR